MKNCLIRPALLLVCIALLSIPSIGQRGRGGSGGGGSTGCATAETPRLSTSTIIIEANASVGVFGRVTNCASGKKRYTVTGSSVSSCGVETVFASGVMSFTAGESKNISVAYPIAPDTCIGPMTVSVSAYSGDTMLSTASTILTVQ